jgi:hypothetical protein
VSGNRKRYTHCDPHEARNNNEIRPSGTEQPSRFTAFPEKSLDQKQQEIPGKPPPESMKNAGMQAELSNETPGNENRLLEAETLLSNFLTGLLDDYTTTGATEATRVLEELAKSFSAPSHAASVPSASLGRISSGR